MAYNVRISPVAKADLRKAVAYYKKEASLKVAQNFVEDYELTLKKIAQNPFFQIYYYELTLKKIAQNPFFQIYYKDFRGLTFSKYPYIIFFQIDETNKLILVKAVFNASQDIGKRPK